MLSGIFALLERSLRVDARARSTHLARFGLVAAIYVSLCQALSTASIFGAPGMRFFQWIATLDVTFMTLMGIGFFSSSITEEKEEDTLGLMLMAGISPLGILMGKSGGRLWQSLLLIAVQYPFILLAVTMGGVMASQIWSVMIALLAYMVYLAGFGLLCSTLAPRSQSAGVWMVIGLILYFIVPSFAKGYSLAHSAWLLEYSELYGTQSLWWTFVGGLGDVCIFLELRNILATGFNDPVWNVQVISNVLAGIACAGLSWLLFGVAVRNPSTEAVSRGLVTRRNSWSPFGAGRAWSNPFLWKDFHFVSGGTGLLLVRTAYYGGLGIASLTCESIGREMMLWTLLCNFLIWVSIPIDAASVVSRSMQDEVRGQTLSSLMMLPRSSVGILYAKLAGSLIGWLPGPIIWGLTVLASSILRDGIWSLSNGRTGSAMISSMFFVSLVLIPHFAALFSLYVRWGAVALAIGTSIITQILINAVVAIIFSTLTMSLGGGIAGYFSLYFGSMIVIVLCLCAACHVAMILRVQALGAK